MSPDAQRLSTRLMRDSEQFARALASDIMPGRTTDELSNWRSLYETILRVVFDTTALREEISTARSLFIRALREKETLDLSKAKVQK
jgi:hypothetical protein